MVDKVDSTHNSLKELVEVQKCIQMNCQHFLTSLRLRHLSLITLCNYVITSGTICIAWNISSNLD